jgi:uncharacterized RDD family membrane protein YckC
MDWFYAYEGKQNGPVSESALSELARAGTVTADTLVWHSGMADWQPYASVLQPPEMPGSSRACSSCGKRFSPEDLAVYGDSAVCAACQPTWVQRLRQGMEITAPATLRYAGFWIRVLANIIDTIVLQIIQYMIFIPLGIMTSASRTDDLLTAAFAVSIAASFVLNLAYFIVFWNQWGATPGKMALGLKIVRADGGRISLGQCIGRYFAELLSALILCIGFMMAGWDDEKRTLHDRICETRVIKTR